jgi:hypothetical protein
VPAGAPDTGGGSAADDAGVPGGALPSVRSRRPGRQVRW